MGIVNLLTSWSVEGQKLTKAGMGFILKFSKVDNAGERIHSKCKSMKSLDACSTYYQTFSTRERQR